MVVVSITDDLASAVQCDGYLTLCGSVLADGEEPPYVGSDPGTDLGLTETEYAFAADLAINGDGLTHPRPDGNVIVAGRLVDREGSEGELDA